MIKMAIHAENGDFRKLMFCHVEGMVFIENWMLMLWGELWDGLEELGRVSGKLCITETFRSTAPVAAMPISEALVGKCNEIPSSWNDHEKTIGMIILISRDFRP